MDCPVDGTQLVMSDRRGVEIDYCPKCRGVWLDRGELDKIIDRTNEELGEESRRDEGERHSSEPRHDDRGSYRKKKRKSFMEDLFEFGG